jgi:hypothetical protein
MHKRQLYDDPTGITIFTVDNVLSKEECDTLIMLTENEGYKSAPITTRKGFVHKPEVRNNGRVIDDNPRRAEWLFDRIKEFLPEKIWNYKLLGLNERFRFYKYVPGQYFKWHFDGAFERSPIETSQLTVLIYLNDTDGGETQFADDVKGVEPKAGRMLIFSHPIEHQGCEVNSGVKYVLRTDVMYREILPGE